MISYAYAQNAAAQDPLISLLPLILMFVVLYFLMIRPQMKRAKEHKNLVENLQKQDEIITSSGIVGKIVNINSTYITLEVGDNQNKTEVIVKRQAAETLLPKGTIKEIF
jgi:preprotein translocase subunit YajC